MKSVVTNLCRLLLAAVFLFSGFVKLNDPVGMSYKINDYLQVIDIIPADSISTIMAVVLGFVEFMLGIYLLLGLSRRLTSLAAFLFTLVLTLLTLYIYVFNPVEDCGCFGDVIHLTHGETLAKNIVLLAMSVVVMLWCKKEIKLMPGCLGWLVGIIVMVAVLGYGVICAVIQPVIDFSPYSEGTDLTEKVPLKAAPDVKVARYQAIDFFVQNSSGEDITNKVLSDSTAYLIVAPDLKSASQKSIGELNRLYEQTRKRGEGFYFVSASGPEDIKIYRNETASEYPVCYGDEKVLRTVMRTNPGVVVLHRGIVAKKWPRLIMQDSIRANL